MTETALDGIYMNLRFRMQRIFLLQYVGFLRYCAKNPTDISHGLDTLDFKHFEFIFNNRYLGDEYCAKRKQNPRKQKQ